jgi:ABC-2 type transport system ATP-binding protein
MSNGPLLSVRGLTKSLGSREILHGISLDVGCGEFLGLIGPNGAGKTTLLRCITAQWTTPEGTVTIDGVDVSKQPIEAKRRFGYAFEPAELLERLTGRQHAAFVAGLRKVASPADEIEKLAEVVDLTSQLDDEVGSYSHGTRRKLGIILALLGNPPLIVMDESLNGLDPVVSYRVKNHLTELAAQGRTGILLASHMLESLEKYCTRIAMIREGRIHRVWTQEELKNEAVKSGRHLEELFVDLMGEQVANSA